MNNFKSRNPILCRIVQQIKERRKFLILNLILQMLSVPVITIVMEILCIHPEYANENMGVFLLIPSLFFAIASLSGIVMAISSFRYLHNKCRADADLSLPMTTDQRFIGDFLSGLIIYAVPYLISAVTSLLIIILTPQTENCMPVLTDYTIGSLILRAFFRNFRNEISELIFMTISGLLIMIMLYTLTCLVAVCCGNIIECVAYTIIVNIIIPLFAYINTFSIQRYNYPMEINDINSWSVNVVSSTSPFGGLIMMINRLKSDYRYDSIVPTPSYWTIKFNFMISVIFIITFVLYRKRKAEDISKPFVFSTVYYLFAAIITMSVFGLLFRYDAAPWAAFFISLIIFSAIDIIRRRGLKKKEFIHAAVLFSGSVAASFLLIKACDAYRINNIRKMPDPDQISSVTLSLPLYYHDSFYNPLVTFTDKDNIGTALDMQRRSLEKNPGRADVKNMQLMYTMKNGKKVYKQIIVRSEEYKEKSHEFINNTETAAVIAHTIVSAFKRYDRTMNITEGYSCYVVPHESLNLSDEQINELSDSIKNDIQNIAREGTELTDSFCIINSCYDIPVEYKDTIETFRNLGITAQ